MSRTRIGIDFGGSKVEIVALDAGGQERMRRRIPSPAAGGAAEYQAGVRAVADLVRGVETAIGETASVGVGIPGVISPATGLVKNANSICLNGHAFDRDLTAALGRPVRVENDANCFALSEAMDGAGQGQGQGQGHRMVFGVILGTGVGAGIVLDGRIWSGRNRVAGEWGHNPLPWPDPAELPGPRCWCGQSGCMETWVAGPALARDCDGPGHRDASGIPARAAAGDARAVAALERHANRLARGLATIINALDPDVIVLGGGLSNMEHLYERIPALIGGFLFTDVANTPVVRNRHGDSSGVRGAAWLWPAEV